MAKITVYEKIQNYLQENINSIEEISSTQIANELSISQASVVKYAKKMGFKGFSELKISKIKEKEIDYKGFSDKLIHNNVSVNDSEDIIVKKIYSEEIKSLSDTMESVNIKNLIKIVKEINNANKIIVNGIGSSGIVAQDLVHKLIKIGKFAIYHADFHHQIIQLQSFNSKDVLINISHSGETKEVLKIVKEAKKNKIKVISITSNLENSLSNLSDFVLITKTEESNLRSSAMSSRISQLFLIDIMFTNLVKLNYTDTMDKINKSRDIIQWKMKK